MPELSRFQGIVVRMFFNDHGPPHFHAYEGWSLRELNSATLRDRPGQRMEFAIAVLNGRRVTTEGTVRTIQVKHGLPGFLGEGHEASVVLEGGERVGSSLTRGVTGSGFSSRTVSR